MAEAEAAKPYHARKYQVFFWRIFLDAGWLLVLLFGRLTLDIRQFAFSLTEQFYLGNLIYIAILFGSFVVIHLPLKYYSGFHLEHQFHLSNQSLGQWLRDQIKQGVLSGLIMAGLLSVMYGLLHLAPQTWWIYAAIIWMTFSFVIARVLPTVIIPLFYKYIPIDNDPLKERIHKMFRQCQVSLREVYAIDFSKKTRKANAFVCGMGQSRRVVLTDTLLENYSDDEIQVVIAHELGHYKHHDLIKLFAANSIFMLGGLYVVDKILRGLGDYFGFADLDDIAGLPLFILVFSVLGLIVTPLSNALSCAIERQADRFSLEATGDPQSFISLMTKLGQQNLSEFEPGRWTEIFFYDHPPLKKRIAFAEGFQVNRT